MGKKGTTVIPTVIPYDEKNDILYDVIKDIYISI